MNRTPIESESILERAHSCKWYFDEAKDFYNVIIGEKASDEHSFLNRIDYIKCLNTLLKKSSLTVQEDKGKRDGWEKRNWKTLASLILRVYQCKDNDWTIPQEINLKSAAPLSVFPLFVTVKNTEKTDFIPNNATNEQIETELFERKKFEICKVLNAVDSIIARLCANNADEMSTGKIVEPKTILKWLYTVADHGRISAQEVNLINTFLQQVLRWYAKHADVVIVDTDEGRKAEEGYRRKAKLWADIFSDKSSVAAKYGWTKEGVEFVKAFVKQSMILTLNDVSTAYERLDGFRRYAIRVELAKDDMLKESELNKLLSLAQAILDFLLSVCVSYMRVNELKLPRTSFREAQMVHSNISGSNFSNSDFNGVDLSFAIAQRCDFSSASLTNIKASSSDFSDSLWSYADLSGADLSDAILNGVKMDAVNCGQTSRAEIIRFSESEKAMALDVSQLQFTPPKETTFLKSFEDAFMAAGKKKANENLSKGSIKNLHDDIKNIVNNDGKKELNYWKGLSVDPQKYDQYQKCCEEVQFGYKRVVCFRSARIKEAMLHDLNLSLVDAELASFRESDLSGCIMAYTNAKKAEFYRTNLSEAKLYKADLAAATFNTALAINTWFADCEMDSVNFTGANLTGARIVNFTENDHIEDSIDTDNEESTEPGDEFRVDYPFVVEPDRDGADEKESDEKQPDQYLNHNNTFNDVIANNILISGIDFSRSSFLRAVLRNATLFNVDTSSSVWDHADLTFARLCGVVFNRSSMKESSLQEAIVRAADFTCCNLSRSKMLGCQMDQALFYDANLSEVNLSHSKVCYTVFRECLFDQLNCSKTTFDNCLFIGIDFSSCVGLPNAVFKNCRFLRCRYDEEEVNPEYEASGKELYYRLGKVNLHAKSPEKGVLAEFSTVTKRTPKQA